jgi:hypothetical protein
LGFIAEQRGDPAAAARLNLTAFDIARALAAPRDLGFALLGLAGAAAVAGQHDQAAQLLGAAAAARDSAALPAGPVEQDEINRITAAVRAALGADRFAAEFALGGETDPVVLRDRVQDRFGS